MPKDKPSEQFENFKDLVSKLFRVPKKEVDAKRKKKAKKAKKDSPTSEK